MSRTLRRAGVAGYPGDGTQRWPAVHALDAAVLFRLALESAPAGTCWHAVGDEGDAVRDIATVIGRRLGLPVESVPQENFGPLVLNTKIRKTVRYAEAPVKGESVLKYDPTGEAAEMYRDLAKEVLRNGAKARIDA